MKRCLIIINSMGIGGAETFLMKINRNIDMNRFQMDYCIVERYQNDYTNEIENLGGKVWLIEPKKNNPIKYYCSIKRIIHENNYKIAIRVSEHSLAVLDLLCAKWGGADRLLFRSSNSKSEGSLVILLHYAFRWLFKLTPIVKVAPSIKAAKYTFGNRAVKNGDVTILKNGLDLKLFEYSDKSRIRIRSEWGIDNNTVVLGHIGRFVEQKNHKFIIDILEYLKQEKHSFLMVFIGEGPLINEIKELVNHKQLNQYCLFLGLTNLVSEYLSAFDVFVFPSFYEGMPNAVIEAQASGLPCIISDAITNEVNVSENVIKLSLTNDKSIWGQKIIETAVNTNRKQNLNVMRKKGYDIQSVVNTLERMLFED